MDALSDTSAGRTGGRGFAALLVALSATLAGFALPAAAGAAAVPARTADSFVDSIGVNTHTYYDDTVYYSRFGTVKQKLAELGVRHIRENLVPDRPDQYERLRELAAIGARSTLIMGDPSEADGLDELLSIVRTELGGAVAALEGPNEFDMWGGSDWISGLRPYQQRLYAAVKSDPALAPLPVVGPSLVQRRNQEALGDISANLDFGNIHSYPDGYSPESNLDRHLAAASENSGAEPVMATESGYHTAVGWSGEHNPVSEAAMATYVPRMFLEYFRRGIVRTFSYELLDEGVSGEREDNFGLLRNDLSEKPAFAALRNTIDILEDPGPGFAPASVAYSLGGDSEDVHHLLLQKRDGSFYLALWRAVDTIDPESGATEPAAGGQVTVQFARQPTGAAALYRPNSSNSPLGTLPTGGGSVSLEVGAEVAIVKLNLGAKRATGRIKAWVSRRSVPAGGRVTVRGRLPKQLAGRSVRVKVQQWRGHGWRTVARGRTRKSGAFRKKIRMPAPRSGRASRVRVVASVAKPSRSLRVKIRRR